MALASMGPRTSIRGNFTRVNEMTVAALLQWGRGLPSAETAHPARERRQRHVASMGPRTSIRGNDARNDHVIQDGQGFNGAADFHPRKRQARPQHLCAMPRFNGAADFHPRKLLQRVQVPSRYAGFNGAADFHPRKQHAFEVFSCQRLALPLASAGRQTVDWTKRTLVPNPQLHACQHLPAASGHRVFALTSTLAPAAKAAHRVSNPW